MTQRLFHEAEKITRPTKTASGVGASKKIDCAAMVLKAIRKIGGGATRDFIKSETGLKEAKLSAILDDLTAAGKLCKTTTALLPGTSRGRNLSFYALPNADLSDRSFLALQTLRSYGAPEVARRGYELFYYNDANVLQFWDEPGEWDAFARVCFAKLVVKNPSFPLARRHQLG